MARPFHCPGGRSTPGNFRTPFSSTVPAPRAVESNAHVAAAAYLMKHADVTALAVVDGREPEQAIGVITTTDVARVIADGKSVDDVRIYQLMRPKRA